MSKPIVINFDDLGTSFSGESGDDRRIAYSSAPSTSQYLDPSDLTASMVEAQHVVETRQRLDQLARKVHDLTQAVNSRIMRVWDPGDPITMSQLHLEGDWDYDFTDYGVLDIGFEYEQFKYIWLQWTAVEENRPAFREHLFRVNEMGDQWDTAYAVRFDHEHRGDGYTLHPWRDTPTTLKLRVESHHALDLIMIQRALFFGIPDSPEVAIND